MQNVVEFMLDCNILYFKLF